MLASLLRMPGQERQKREQVAEAARRLKLVAGVARALVWVVLVPQRHL